MTSKIRGSAPQPAPAQPSSTQSTLQKKLEPYDVNHDGKLSLKESMDVFESVGLPKGWSFASAVGTAIARGPIGLHEVKPSDLWHPQRLLEIDLTHIQKTVLKGQSGVWSEQTGNSDPQKAAAFISEVAKLSNAGGDITLDGIKARVEQDVTKSVEGMGEPEKSLQRKRRFGESYSAWVVLMELAGHENTNGQRVLTPDQVKTVFDGTIFDMLRAQHSDKVSVSHMTTELLVEMLKA